MTPIEYMTEYNAQTKNVISVSDEFKDKMRPPLLRIFMKRNIGMTDEQLVGYYVLTDAVTKVVMVYGLMNQNKELINSLKEMSVGFTQPPQQAQSQYNNKTTANTTQERVYEEPKPNAEPDRETPRETPKENL